ncbi:MAG: portal protein [Pseudomonadota bacterium]
MNAVTQLHSSDFAKEAMRRWDELRAKRSIHEQDWEDIARLIRPQRGGFGMGDHRQRIHEKPLSSEPIQANNSMASGIYAGITNPANRWFGLQTPDKEFNNWQPMAEWLDVVTARTVASFGLAASSFYPSTFQGYSDISAFGQFAAYDEVDLGERRFIDQVFSLAEIVVDIDAWGRVVEMVRKFPLKPRAALRHYKKSSDFIPPKIKEMAEKLSNDDIWFYQHVFLNDGYSAKSLGPKGKKWLSVHACEIDSTTVRMSGFHEMPFYFPRWDVDSGMTYGTGPGFVALASSRANHLMEAATLRSSQFAADPTLLAPNRNALPLQGKVRPGEVLYGGVNTRGDRMVHTLDRSGSIGLTIEEKRQKVEEIKNAFHYALMSLHNRTGLNTEELQIIEEAKLRNWAPHGDRIMEEYAARKVERRVAMLWRSGQLPPPPQEAAGMPLGVRYQSAAQMALRAREGLAIRQFIGDLGPLAQTDPRYLDRVSPDGLVEALHDANPSLPASILRPREEADAIANARAKAQEQQQQAEQLTDAAKAAGPLLQGLNAAQGNQQ